MKFISAAMLGGIAFCFSDLRAATAGDDIIVGGPGNDLLFLLTGDDEGNGAGGNDTIFGDDGSDTLLGGIGRDFLIGGSLGSNGDTAGNILIGGGDDDFLIGGTFGDDYHYELGDGFDIIREFEQSGATTDRIIFEPGIDSTSIAFTRSRADLFVDYLGTDILLIESWFAADGFRIEEFHFDDTSVILGSSLLFDGVTWTGTVGIDTYTAPTADAYRMEGLGGGDTLSGGTNGDVLLGGDGDDYLSGNGGDDGIYGQAGNDTLRGNDGSDALFGGDGVDTLLGQNGDDILVGGVGNDSLQAGAGNDVYLWELGDGNDTVTDSTSEYAAGTLNTLKFGPGITPDRVAMIPSGANLKFVVNDASGQPIGSVEIVSWYTLVSTGKYHHQFWKIVFADGVEWVGATIGTPAGDTFIGGSDPDTFRGAAGNDTLTGNGGDDELYGETGTDTLNGGSGNDLLVGGPESDYLYGGLGNDTYVWELGDGNDTIVDVTSEYLAGTLNILKFGPGVSPGRVMMTPSGSNLKFVVNDVNGQPIGSVDVSSWYTLVASSTYHRQFWKIVFDDGTEWMGASLATPAADTLTGGSGADTLRGGEGDDNLNGGDGDDILYGDTGNDTLKGNAGNDLLIGGEGNDNLYGGTGNDDFTWNLVDGDDVILGATSEFAAGSTKRIVFGPGILPSDVTMVSSSWPDLKFVVNNSGGQPLGSVKVTSWYSAVSGSHRYRDCFKIVFANGTEWIGKTMATPGEDLLTGGAGADILYGAEGGDTLTGNDGDDQLYGGGGIDTLKGDAGNDILLGGPGNDNLYGGTGNDDFIWNLADGDDSILGSSSEFAVGSTKQIIFGPGILPSDVTMVVTSPDLKFVVNNSSGQPVGSIRVPSWYSTVSGSHRYRDCFKIVFANGTEWIGKTMATPGGDLLTGGAGPDIFYGAEGGDTLTGGDGDDELYGDAGNDTLNGGNGNDLLNGGDGVDYLYGNAGADILRSGAGADILYGSTGNDTYHWELGDGDDYIEDAILEYTAGTMNILDFGAGILPEQVELVSGDGLKFVVKDENGQPIGSVRIKDWYVNVSGIIRHRDFWKIVFDDGTEWIGLTLATPGSDVFNGGSGSDVFHGGDGNDTLNGGGGDDTLYGENDNDTLKGDAGNDILIGGAGTDNLYGGAGNDDFIWNLADGDDSILGSSSEFAVGSTKRIIFGPGILPSDVTMVATSTDLTFVVNDSDGQPAGSIVVDNWYSIVAGSHRYRDCFKIVFENGTEWIGNTMATPGVDLLTGGTGTDVFHGAEGNDTLTGNDGDDQLYGGAANDTLNGGNGADLLDGGDGADNLYGNAGDDILSGGIGVDNLSGGDGNDQYLWTLGDGSDVITDLYTELNASNRLVLSGIPDVTWLDIQRDGSYLLKINVPALNGFAASTITINDWARTSGGVHHLKSWLLEIDGVGAFRFANLPTTSADTATGTTGDDLMLGLAGNDSLQAGDGNDLLYGGDGADVLDAGAGNDLLVGGLGDDSLSGADGNDSYYINAGDGTDTITESASTTGNIDKLIFGSGIEANEIIVERNGNDLILKSKTTVNEVILKDWFSTAERFYAVEHLEFADGITWEIPFVESRVGDGAGSDNGEGDLGDHEVIGEEDLNDSLENQTPVISSMQVLTPLH